MINEISQKVKQRWLQKVPTNPEDYLKPNYYNQLLKEYSFGGLTDLELLHRFLISKGTAKHILELGCGSGRATEQILDDIKSFVSFDLVDLSNEMVDFCKQKYKEEPNIIVHRSDTVNYLDTSQRYDLVISLWNLSHSIHQHMIKSGRVKGSNYVRKIIEDFIVNKVERSGSIYIIHYDIQSPEQRLINPWRTKLWEKSDPSYKATDQSPSKQLLDTIFSDLQQQGIIDYSCDHLNGDPIEYESMEVALETFLNFHMEGYFNQRPELPEVIKSLTSGFEKYKEGNVIKISPGAFIFEIIRK